MKNLGEGHLDGELEFKKKANDVELKAKLSLDIKMKNPLETIPQLNLAQSAPLVNFNKPFN